MATSHTERTAGKILNSFHIAASDMADNRTIYLNWDPGEGLFHLHSCIFKVASIPVPARHERHRRP